MNTVIEKVEFQAVAPKRALPGLDYTINRLDALGASLKRVQAQLAGLSSNAAFRLSAKQYQDRAFNSKGQPVLQVNELARRLGFDPKDVRSAATLIETEIQSAIGKINRAIERNAALGKRALASKQQQIRQLQGQSFFTDASSGSFKNTAQAGKFFERYAQMALKNKEQGEKALMAILSGSVPTGGTVSGGTINPGNLSKAVADAIAAAGAKSGKRESGKAETKKAAQKAYQASGGGIIETRTSTPANPEKPVRTTVRRVVGDNVIEETVHENDEELKTTVVEALGKRAKAELKGQLLALKNELKAQLPASAGRKDGMKSVVGNIAREADLLREKYGPLGLGGLVDAFTGQTVPDVVNAHSKRLGSSSGTLDRQRQSATTRAFLDDYKRDQSARAALEKQRQAEQTKNFLAEEKRRASAGVSLDKQRQKTQTKNYYTEEKERQAQQQVAAAQYTVQDLRQRGAIRTHSETDKLTGQILSERYQLAGDPNQYHVSYGKGGAQVTAVQRPEPKAKADRLTSAIEGLGVRNMAANLIKVTAWGVAVTALYKSVELARYSLEKLEQTGSETAHLGNVFRGVGGTAQDLTKDIIGLAAAQGRETEEAMESATEWARLGGTRKQIYEEVRVSARVANLAEMGMGETTRQLAALMHIFGLESGDLNGVLGMLVNTSLTWNVSLEDIFGGLDRAAGAARVAGVSLAELQAMIGTVVGKTGQSGIVVGNTIKSMLVQLSNPAIQKALRGLGVEALGNNLQMKPGGQILRELAMKWQTGMDDTGKREVVRMLPGRLSAARFTPLMDDYLVTQKLAIDGQLNMNKAQSANAGILSTLKAQLAGVRGEFDQLIVTLGNKKLGILGGGSISDAAVGGLRTVKNLLRVGSSGVGDAIEGIAQAAYPVASLLGATGLPGKAVGEFNDWAEEDDLTDAQRFEKSQQELVGGSQAEARKASSFYGFGLEKAAKGKVTQADINMLGSEMDPASAAGLQKSFTAGDTAGVQTVLRDQIAKSAAVARAKYDEASANDQHEQRINKTQLSAQEKKVGDMQRTGAPKEDIEKETAALDELKKAQSDLADQAKQRFADEEANEGATEQVLEKSQQYADILREQGDALERIGRLHTQVPAFTPEGQMDQQYAAAQDKLKLLEADANELKDAPMVGKSHVYRGQSIPDSEYSQMLLEMQARQKAAGEELYANRPGGGNVNRAQARTEHYQTLGSQQADREAGAHRFGVDETDKLANERNFISQRLEQLGKEKDTEEKIAEIRKLGYLQEENALNIRNRQADVEREILQLSIDQNKEFSKSFLNAGPAEKLRKLAAFRMAQNGGLSDGQMYSLSPGLSQDYQQISGNNPDMRRLKLEKNRIDALAQGLPGFADGGFTGSGPADQVAGVVHKGEYVLSQRDLFDLHHGNLFPRGGMNTPVTGGGVYRPAGIPLDHFGPPVQVPTQERWLPGWHPGNRTGAPTIRIPTQERWLPETWSPARLAGQAMQAARNPMSWANAGRWAGHGLLGGAVTGAINYGGSLAHPALGRSDNYGGALYGLGADAAGGAVAGRFGGPLGAAIGAVSGMVVGDVSRLVGGIHGIYATQRDDARIHGQVSRAQQRRIRQQMAALDMPASPTPRSAASQADHDRFAAQERAWAAHDAARGPDATGARTGPDWAHPASVIASDSGVTRTYKMPDGRYADYNGGDLTPHYHADPNRHRNQWNVNPPGFKNGGYTGDGPADEVAGVVHRGEIVIPKKDVDRSGGHDVAAYKACEAALGSLAGTAGKLEAAFTSLGSRVDQLFAGGGGALKFQGAGQSGGWYPGKRDA